MELKNQMAKKILIFSFAYYPYVGGAEVAIKEITDRLSYFQFDLVTSNFSGEKSEEVIGGVNVYRISSFTKYLFPIKSFIRGLILQRKNHYDVVWSVMANTGFAALFLKLLFPRINFILTIQEGDPIPQIKRRVQFVYPIFKMVFKRADQVTAISNYLSDFAREMGAKTVMVIPNGVDIKKFKIRNKKVRIDDKKQIVLVTTGRLVKKNALNDIIKCLKFLPENIVFKSVGSGQDEKYLRDLASELGLRDRVLFLPYTDHAAMSEILQDADIFIRPSLSEGLGSSFLEAMAVGLPIIGTRVGGIPDFLEDNLTGLFCEVNNPEDIALKVMTLVGNQELYQKISLNNRKVIEEKYDWEIIAGRFKELF